MAQLAIAAVGALALGPVGLGLTTAGTGFMLGSLAYSLMAPGQKSYGARLGDLKVTGTEYGSTIPWVIGMPRISGQIIWASNRRETATEQEQGKGGGATSTSYTYDVDLLILLSESQIAGLRRIWSNGELVFDGTTAKEGLWNDLRVYTGADDQLPDPTYEAAVGLGNAPAYRGMGTVLIQGLQLGNGGNIPNLTFEVSAGGDALEPYLLFDYEGEYDQGQGAFCNASSHPIFPLSTVHVGTRIPNPVKGSTFTVSKTLTVQAGFPLVISLYHDNSAELTINGEKVDLSASSAWTSQADYTPKTTSVVLVLKVTEDDEADPGNYAFAAFRVIQMRHVYQGWSIGTAQLRHALSELLERAGYSEDDFNISGVSEDRGVHALAVGQVSTTRSVLEPVQQAHFLEVSAHEVIHIRERAVDAVVAIPFADLGMSSDSGGEEEPLSLTLGNDLELPAQLALSYPNMSGDYQAATEFSDRLISGQQSTETVQLALGLHPGEAKGIVDGLLMDRVASLCTTTLKLPLKYARVEPGDVVQATGSDGRSYRLRVQSKTDSMPIIELQCVLDDVGAIESAAVTDTGYVDTNTVIQPAGTLFELLDLPILRDADDAPGYYVAVAPLRAAATDKWPGAAVAQAWDAVNYTQILQTTAQCVIGTASNALPAWSGGVVFDERSTVTVQVSGELSSSTREAMLLDESINALLLGSEIVRFRSAALLSAGTYLLSGLLRGQRGTEWAMGSHAAGERCVLLGNGLRRIGSQTNEINLPRQIKAVTLGAFLSSGTAKDFTDTGVALKPFSPANLRALPDGHDLVVTWQRRTRRSYQYAGAAPVVPLGEAVEAYRVRVFAGSTLLRSDVVNESTYRYTADMQAADGLASGTALQFETCQLSATAGPGYPSTVGAKAP